MANNKKRPLSRLLKGLCYLISLLLAAGVCSLGILMLTGHFEGLSQPEAVGAAPLHAGQTENVPALQETFGLPLPHLPGYPMRGQALNVNYNGHNVRKAILQYDGFTITCVQPAFAAPLLLHSELSLSMEGEHTVAGLPAALAEGDNTFCFYFSTEEAAFSLFAPNATRDTFLALAEMIALTK